MHYQKLFNENRNCLMLSEWECLVGGCGYHFLTSLKSADAIACPKCGANMDGAGRIVLSQVECRHEATTDGHAYRPGVLKD